MLGSGFGLASAPAVAAAVATMPGAQAGVASAVANSGRQVGGALGVAVLGAVATARFTAVLPGRLAAAGLPAPVRERIQADAGKAVGVAPDAGSGAEAAARETVASAFVTGIHAAYLLAGLALAIGALVALLLLRPRGHEPEGATALPAEAAAPGSAVP
jgi:hypothetical protein